MRVLVFGASITQGFWDTQGGWVQRLRGHYDKLKIKDIKNENALPDIFNLGISGDTIQDVTKRFKAETAARAKASSPVFIFAVGTNNAIADGHGKRLSTNNEYRDGLAALIEEAKKYSDKILCVGLAACEENRTTPVFWRDIYYTNQAIGEIEKTMQEVCRERGIPQVAVFEAFQKEMAKGSQLFVDGLHPNDQGHELIFQLVRPQLDKLMA